MPVAVRCRCCRRTTLCSRDVTNWCVTLPAAFAALKSRYGSNYPSMMCLITGPSRTGDIERILVLGAHGPKKLTVFCM